MPTSPFQRAAQEGLTANSSGNSTIQRRPRGRRPEGTADWAPAFIGALMEGASVRKASKVARVDLTMPYKRRAVDAVFKQAWQEACDIGTEFLEQEAARRAYHGVLEPVFHKGIKCGYTKKYSDTLMIFLLKARKPEKYREGVEDGVRGSFVLNINVETVAHQEAPVDVTPVELPEVELCAPATAGVTATDERATRAAEIVEVELPSDDLDDDE